MFDSEERISRSMISNTQRDFAKETYNFAFNTHFIIVYFIQLFCQKGLTISHSMMKENDIMELEIAGSMFVAHI